MTVYIPSNLDLDSLLKEKPVRLVTNKKGPKKDYLAFVIGVVSDGIIKGIRDSNHDDFSAPIWSELLKEFTGEYYKKYIGYLVWTKVLYTTKQFFIGKARRYSFTENYKTSLKPYQITDKKLIRKVDAHFRR